MNTFAHIVGDNGGGAYASFKRARKRGACEALSESDERDAGGGAEGKPDAV